MKTFRKVALAVAAVLLATLIVRVAMKEKRSGLVFAGDFQLYVADGEPGEATAASEFWSESAYESRLAVGRGVLGVRTSSAFFVPVAIRLESPRLPLVTSASASHVVEAPLRVDSGTIRVWGCPDHDPGIAIRVAPGDYTVRIECSSVSDDGSELWWNGDRYLISILPRKSGERVILRNSATEGPNKAPEPTRTSVTSRADARLAPAARVAHL